MRDTLQDRLRKNRGLSLWFLFSALIAAWLIFSLDFDSSCEPNYNPSQQEFVHYSQLLSEHKPTSLINSLTIALICWQIAGLLLLFLSANKRVVILSMLSLYLFICLFICIAVFNAFDGLCSDMTLSHLESINFNDGVYHLTRGDLYYADPGGHVIHLFLFECDMDGEICKGRIVLERGVITGSEAPTITTTLVTNQDINQLQVWVNQDIVYIVESKSET